MVKSALEQYVNATSGGPPTQVSQEALSYRGSDPVSIVAQMRANAALQNRAREQGLKLSDYMDRENPMDALVAAMQSSAPAPAPTPTPAPAPAPVFSPAGNVQTQPVGEVIHIADAAQKPNRPRTIFDAIAEARKDPAIANLQDRLIAENASPETVAEAIRGAQSVGNAQLGADQYYNQGQPERTTNNTVGPQYGLSGAENAVNTGLRASLAALDTGVSSGADAITGAQGNLSPYMQAGGNSAKLMADLTGANGPEAQAAARGNYQASPGYDFIREEALRAVRRDGAARGMRPTDANVMRALQDRAAGLAAQDYGNYFGRLSGVAGQGLQGNQINAGLGQSLASLYGNAGNSAASALSGAGNNIANMRYTTGINMANMTNNTANNMANLTNQGAVNLNNLMAQTGGNISNLLTGGTTANANQLTNLATILANLSQGQGSAQAQIDAGLGRTEAGGIVDSAAGMRTGISNLAGLGTMAAGGLPSLGGLASFGGGGVSNITPNQWMYGNF